MNETGVVLAWAIRNNSRLSILAVCVWGGTACTCVQPRRCTCARSITFQERVCSNARAGTRVQQCLCRNAFAGARVQRCRYACAAMHVQQGHTPHCTKSHAVCVRPEAACTALREQEQEVSLLEQEQTAPTSTTNLPHVLHALEEGAVWTRLWMRRMGAGECGIVRRQSGRFHPTHGRYACGHTAHIGANRMLSMTTET